jgi:2-C-methyl-D-erythritol 4-phosphate cytidylyltransferase
MGKVVALIASAGKGSRMQSGIEKPYLTIGSKPILAHTLAALDLCQEIDEYVIIVDPGRQTDCRHLVVDRYGFTRVRKIVQGGETRQESVYQGLKSLNADTTTVVVHDAARPCVTPNLVSSSLQVCASSGAALVAVPVKDTVKSVVDGIVTGTPDRRTLWLAQTPQTFSFDVLLRAHEQALEDGFVGTDDAALVERMGHQVHVVAGDYENFKVTTPEDLNIAERVLSRRAKIET